MFCPYHYDCDNCPEADCIAQQFPKSNSDYYAEHREVILERSKAYYEAHREACIERSKRYYLEHREKLLAYQIARYHSGK